MKLNKYAMMFIYCLILLTMIFLLSMCLVLCSYTAFTYDILTIIPERTLFSRLIQYIIRNIRRNIRRNVIDIEINDNIQLNTYEITPQNLPDII